MATTLTSGVNSLQLVIDPPLEDDLVTIRDDLVATRVWVSTTNGFTPGPANLVYDGPGLSITIPGLLAGTTYYVRYALISSVDVSVVVTSAQLSATVSTLNITGELTNSPVVVAADNSGTVAGGIFNTSATNGTFRVFESGVEKTTGAGVVYSVQGTPTGGLSISINSSTGVYSVTGLTSDSGSATLRAVYQGVNYDKVYTISKSKAGAAGAAGTAYWIQTSAPAVQKSQAGVYTPSTVTYTLRSATGTASPVLYAGRFTIETSTDGTTYGAPVYTSSVDQSSYTYTVPSNIKTIRARGYLAGGTTTLLDEVITTIVNDGADGLNGGLNAYDLVYTNTSHTVPVTNLGVETWTGSGGIVNVYDGTTLYDLDTTTLGTSFPTINSRYRLGLAQVSGDTLTLPSVSGTVGQPTATINAWSGNLTTGTVYRLTAYIRTATGVNITRFADISISPSFQGDAGAAAVSAVLSNDNHSFTAQSDGTVSTYVGSGTEIRVYEGTTELTYDGVGTANGTWRITTPAAGTVGNGSNGATNITVGTYTNSGTFVTVGQHSGVAAGTDTSSIIYNITGKTASGASFSINRTQTFSKSKQGNNGTNGTNGTNTALVYAYKRAAVAPTDNPGAVDYSFTTNTITTATLANSWQKTIPAGSNPLYVTVATAASTGSTDTIAAGEWSSPVLLVQDGSNGTNGLNVAILYLYARNNSTSSAPALVTTGSATYTFSTRTLSGTIPAGWTTTVPSAAGGTVLWVTTATASSTTDTDSIANTEWATPQILAQKGDTGDNAVNGYLTNEAHVVVSASDGTGYSLTNGGGTFKVFNGTTDVTTSSTFAITGGTDGGASWTKVQNGLTLTINETTGVYSVSGASWTSDSEVFTLTATYNGTVITKQYVIAKSKTGGTGLTGQHAPSMSYSNSSHTVPVDKFGAETWTGSGGVLTVFEGSNKLLLRSASQSTTVPAAGTAGYVIDIVKLSGDTLNEDTAFTLNASDVTIDAWSGNLTTVTVYRITAYIRLSNDQTTSLSIDVTLTPAFEGTRGTVITSAAASAQAWSDSEANAAIVTYVGAGATPINGDVVTLYNGTWSQTRRYGIPTASSWNVLAAFFGGDVLVDGTLTAAKLAANSVTADKIAAGSITASKITVADLSNIIPGGELLQSSDWSLNSGTVTWITSPSSTWQTAKVAQLDAASGSYAIVSSGTFPVLTGDQLYFHYQGQVVTGTGSCFAQIMLSAASDFSSPQYLGVGSVTETSPTIKEGIVTVPTGMRYARVQLVKGNTGATSAYIGAPVIRRASSAELIVDGAITTNKMTANTINGDRISTDSLNADRIVAGSITANRIAANTITTDKLLVTGSNLIPNSDFASNSFAGWRVFNNPGSNSITTLLSTDVSVPSGAPTRYVARFQYTGTSTTVSVFSHTKAYNDTGADQDGFAVEAGEQYNVTFYAVDSADYSGAFNVRAYFYKSDGTVTTTVNILTPTLTTSWTQYSGNFTVPAGALRCWIYVQSPSHTAGTVWWTGLRCWRRASADLIVDGAITATKVSAGSITTDKLTITNTSNLIDNPDFEYGQLSWSNATTRIVNEPANAYQGSWVLKYISTLSANALVSVSNKIYVEPGEYYRFSGYLKADAGATGNFFWQIRWYNAAGTVVQSDNLTAAAATTTTWTQVSGIFDVPTGLGVVWVQFAPYTAGVGTFYWDNASVTRAADGNLIVDGAITANKIQAGTITGNEIAGTTITAANIASGAITTNKLFVTGGGAALNLDTMCADSTAWLLVNGSPSFNQAVTDAPGGSTALVTVSGQYTRVLSNLIPIDPVKNYRYQAYYKQDTATAATIYHSVAWYDANGTLLGANVAQPTGAGSPAGWPSNGTYSYAGAVNIAAPTTWTQYTASFGPDETAKIPSNAKFFRVGAILNNNSTVGAIIRWNGVRVVEKAGSDLIVDGSITASKILAGAVTADKISTGTLAANTSITVGTSANGILLTNSSSQDRIEIRQSSVARVTLGYTASGVYGLQLRDSTGAILLDSNELTAVRSSSANDSYNLGDKTTNPSFAVAGSGSVNLAIGEFALYSTEITPTSTRLGNVAIGKSALRFASSGGYNTAVGHQAARGASTTTPGSITGSYNTYLGYNAGYYLSSGSNNIGIGYRAGRGSNTVGLSGTDNIALGYDALLNATSGSFNTVIGTNSGKSLTTGSNNVFLGYATGQNITTGDSNIAIGSNVMSLAATVTAFQCVGIGLQALASLSSGSSNIALGTYSAFSTTIGTNNITIGTNAGYSLVGGSQNVIIGSQAAGQSIGSDNTLIGYSAGVTLTNGVSNVMIGSGVGSSAPIGLSNSILINHSGSGLSAGDIAIATSGTPRLMFSASTNTLTVSNIVSASSFTSTVATGTAPFTVASTTAVTNLNADLLDGIHSTGFLRMSTNTWQNSEDTQPRFYFGTNGRSYYRSPDGHEFRDAANTQTAFLSNVGAFSAIGSITGTHFFATGVNSRIEFAETDATDYATGGGRFRIISSNGTLRLQRNTATAGDYSTLSNVLSIDSTGDIYTINTTPVSTYSIGYRGRPTVANTATATKAAVGQCYLNTAAITINPNVFAAGDIIYVYNNSAAAISITQGTSMTLRLAGTATTGTRTLAQRGFAEVMFISATEAVVYGTGVT